MAASMRTTFGKISRNILNGKCNCSRATGLKYASTQTKLQEERTDLYPEIKPKYPDGNWGDIEPKLAWKLKERGDSILAASENVKERLEHIAGTENKYLSRVRAFERDSDTVDFKKYICKTHIEANLPSSYDNISVDEDAFKFVKSLITEAILENSEFDNSVISNKYPIEQCNRHELLGKISRILLAALSVKEEHLISSQVDENVRVESYWWRSGYADDEIKAKGKKGNGIIPYQFQHVASWQIRTEKILPQFVARDDAISTEGNVPDYRYPPQVAGSQQLWTRPTSISGHWIGDPCEFGLLSMHTLSKGYDRFLKYYGPGGVEEMSLSAAITASFGWCVAQAYNQGFTYLHDVSYPITTQTIISDGQWFRLAAYQLNTVQLWKDNDANPLNNIMWTTDQQNLYDTIENGQVKGFNDDVLKMLLKFYCLRPVDRGIDLRPYLQYEAAPVDKDAFINDKGEEPFEVEKIGRFQYPRNAVYF